MSYQESDQVAVANAGRFLKEANADAIKLEGGVRTVSRIRAIVDAGILVCGHIGLTPQSSGQLGGHKAQGRTAESAELVIKDAIAIQEAGAQLLLLEAVPPELSSIITRKLDIPVYGIGAGLDTCRLPE
jgi:3-methyl-2-oxobutanoate hydroxymethyltransferase